MAHAHLITVQLLAFAITATRELFVKHVNIFLLAEIQLKFTIGFKFQIILASPSHVKMVQLAKQMVMHTHASVLNFTQESLAKYVRFFSHFLFTFISKKNVDKINSLKCLY